ncbi:hypothetical protein ABVT39_024092 [Epinephelus coioides]
MYGEPEEDSDVSLWDTEWDSEYSHSIPSFDPEDFEPISQEESSENFEDAVVLESSGSASSMKRTREDSDGEEAAAKRRRWAEESDSD